MSKRLSDTEIWKKPWFYDLPDKYKLFWFYILSDCDPAGIWTANFKVLKAYLGEIDQEKIQEYFKNQITILNGGKYWFVNDFIKFQYGYPVSPKHKMFNKLSELLTQRNLNLDTVYDTVSIPYTIGYQEKIDTVKDKDKDKDIKGVQGGKIEKKKQPPITYDDLTDELMKSKPNVYRLGKMLLENCPDIMAMDHPMSLMQLDSLINKYGVDPVDKILKAMQNKGIVYLRKKDCHYAFLTVESWIK